MTAPNVVRALAVLWLLPAIAGCGGPAGSTPPTAGTQAPPAAPTASNGFPTGTFTKEITAEDYAAAGVTDPNVGNNTGRFTLVLGADGTWTGVLDSGGATQVNPVFRGTFSVTGTDVAFATTYPDEYAGAVAHYSWRVDDAGLWTTITSSPDPLELLLAKAIDAEPWVLSP
jgi:hypothetical protein